MNKKFFRSIDFILNAVNALLEPIRDMSVINNRIGGTLRLAIIGMSYGGVCVFILFIINDVIGLLTQGYLYTTNLKVEGLTYALLIEITLM